MDAERYHVFEHGKRRCDMEKTILDTPRTKASYIAARDDSDSAIL